MKNLRRWRLSLHALLSRGLAWLSIVAVVAIGGTVRAQWPAPVGTVNIPAPDTNAYSTSLRYDASGNLYAWDGLSVWEQSGGTGSFNPVPIGSVMAGNGADAGPISFSQDGQTLLLSNGAGGAVPGGNGLFWTMPVSGGSATQVLGSGVPYAGDALALPAASTIPGSSTKYLVYAANDDLGGSSSLSIFDASTGTSQVVVGSSPGATTSIAINPTNNSVYIGVGYDGNDLTQTGKIYSFSLSLIGSAYSSGIPINFTSGTPFNPAGTGFQNGGGMFFDKNGYLFSGGDGFTVFQPNGTICFDQPVAGVYGYAPVTYNAANNEVLYVPDVASGPSTGILYNAADFEPAFWTNPAGGTWGLGSNWSGSPLSTVGALVFAGSTSGTATVTLDGSRSANALQFGDSSAAGSYTIGTGTAGALTLGTSTGTWITVVSGTNAISAPIVLAGSLAVSASAGASLQLGNISQGTTPAALSLSGDGKLVLSGSDNYTGGTTVDGGTLDVTNPSALPDGSALTVGSDATAFGASSSAPAAFQDSPAAVPEPGTLALLAAGGLAWFAARFLRGRGRLG
jgi:autotransporter-associated beta strand protein